MTLTKQFDSIGVIENITFDVQPGEFLTIVGPSGCGKSTLLRITAGLENASTGHVSLNGVKIEKPSSQRCLVSQEYTSFPWLTVGDNIKLAMNLAGFKPEADSNAFISELLRQVDLFEWRDSKPHTLSGGMKQRLAIIRALSIKPQILLMDEPFGALDHQTREVMRIYLLNLWFRHKPTILFVTHDLREALFLSERILLLTPKPMKVRKVIKNGLEYPRLRQIVYRNDFLEMEKEVRNELET